MWQNRKHFRDITRYRVLTDLEDLVKRVQLNEDGAINTLITSNLDSWSVSPDVTMKRPDYMN